MYAKTLILTAGLTLLGTVPAAWAQYRTDDRPYPPQTDEQRGPAYGPDYGQVARAAHEIQQTAASINFQAFRNNRRPNDQEAEMLDRLRDLSTRSRHFQAEIARSRDLQYTVNDFQALADSFDATADAMRVVNRRPYLDQGMARIAYLMNQLAPAYGVNLDFRARLGYGDRDRDRDGDRYRDRDRDRNYDRDGYRPPVR
jgi:hypothetical protein